MKCLRIVFIFLVLTGNVHAQVKILFDATKAEAAGNADWVIDADQHNLGYSSGPAILNNGDESNAQKIPTPAQSGVTQSTSETYWEGAISAWGIDCVKKGYTVETLPYNGQITYGNAGNAQDLSKYKVFIVCEPNILFIASEKTAILHFVQNGGGLFMVSDHDNSDRNNDGYDSPHIWNDLMSNNSIASNPFGMTFDYADFSQTTTNIPNLPSDPLLHGPMGAVTRAQWSGGTTMTLSTSHNSSVVGVVYKTGSSFGSTNVMVAHATYGSGRVAGIGDSSPCDDGTGDPNDQLYNGWTGDANGNHEKLLMNATIWLASSTVSGIESADLPKSEVRIYPNPVDKNCTIDIGTFEGSSGPTLIVHDILGKEVLRINDIHSNTISLNTENLLPGLYFFRVLDGGKSLGTGKFVKE
ncbi:MAG: T9SS type A sorting domain-containing protein [Bacteroidetes bacterium]|nr:T9SS type A sorting domain-containing protein [Bacteroidota bacterium]